MGCQRILGNEIAARVRQRVKEQAAEFQARTGLVPGLATLLVGDDPASHTYVRMKHQACSEVGLRSFGKNLPSSATQAEVEAAVRELAENPEVHGILVQLPLPDHIDEAAVLAGVPLAKDVDGFHPVNMGLLAQKGSKPHFVPCTPAGCIVLLEESGVTLEGARAVVVGRNNIVGMPVALLLLERNATVTIVHSRTKDMTAHLKEADVVVVAIGRPGFVTGDMLKPGAAVIDVGINKVDAPDRERGYRIVGDVDFESAEKVAGYLTPVPGGVGPMTIAMLLSNTLEAAVAAAPEPVRP